MLPEKAKKSLDNRFQSLEQSIQTLEEVSTRLESIQDALLPLSDDLERTLLDQTEKDSRSANLQSLLNQIEIVARMLEQVELETDILERRISNIENLKTRQSG